MNICLQARDGCTVRKIILATVIARYEAIYIIMKAKQLSLKRSRLLRQTTRARNDAS